MQEQSNRRFPLGIVAGISAVVLAAAGGTGWWALNSLNSQQAPPATTSAISPQVSESPKAVPNSAQKQVQIYWLKGTGNSIEVVPLPVALNEGSKQNDVLESAFKRLLAGPTNPAVTSTIPQGTKLRSVEVRSDGVHVDLSQEFTTGGGSTSMTGRVAQVLYTATSLNPNAKVWLEVDGKQLDVLGGEGLLLDQPLTRKNFQENFQL